ncbi:MAG: CPBP family intramembrane metalloprotease [Cyclobacteriaceae bacterium]|nr:CPBP family intramembrane metalloprotease [Cyclobacteriaceae bacterium]
MNTVVSYIRNFLKEDFNPKYYLSVALFLGICVYMSYNFGFNTYVNRFYGKPLYFVFHFLMYVISYYMIIGIQVLFKREIPLKSFKFWGLSLIGILIISLDVSLPYYKILTSFRSHALFSFGYSIFKETVCVITIIFPLWFLWKKYFDTESFFGLTFRGFDWKPYAVLLLLMFIVIAISLQSSPVSNYYPTYKSGNAHTVLGISEWIIVAIYELFYGLDFISIELFYRGFMVIGLGALLGKEAIMPMASLYCFLHFGKPYPETISSIFGGYILGIIALYSRNILGGVFIHVGIAWMMELLSYLRKIS